MIQQKKFAIACLLINQILGLKILVAGDQDIDNRNFFTQIAEKLSEKHTVFVLSRDLQPVFKYNPTASYFKYGMGKHDGQIVYNTDESEIENYRRLDIETLRAYFSFEPMLMDLRRQKFDVGIGGLNLADSVLFRHLKIPYIKISQEDIEATTMQVKLNMPVITSTYPSAQIFSQYSFQTLPQDFGSLEYRWPMFQQYQLNKMDMYMHRSAMIQTLHPNWQSQISDYDQDHALFIGQGATAGLWQSIMLKPPNVVNVYPLGTKRNIVNLPDSWTDSIVVFSLESTRADDLMKTRQFQLEMRIRILDLISKSISVVVIAKGELLEELKQHLQDGNGLIKYLEEPNTNFNHNAKQMYYVSTCRQSNLLSAIQNKAIMIGYFNPLSQTQKFNCHKLALFGVGYPLLEDQLNLSQLITQRQNIQIMQANVDWYNSILDEKENEDKMDLEYWVDYVHQFGVDHKIPPYDNMSTFVWFNMDLVAIGLCLIYACYRLVKWWISIACCCGDEKDKVKQE